MKKLFLILIAFLMMGGVAMASFYLLVKAIDGFNPDDPMTFNAGYPVLASPKNQLGIGKQVPPIIKNAIRIKNNFFI